jgi:hypothetical protein
MTFLAGLIVAGILWLVGDAMHKSEMKERDRDSEARMRARYYIKDED